MKAVTVRRTLLLVLALLFTLLLANVLVGCGTVRNDPEPEPTPAPPVETPFELRLGALTLTPETERAAFDGADAPIDALIGAHGELKALREIDLGLTGASMEELRALEEAYPQAEVKWKVSVLGEEIDGRAESLELCAAADEDVSDLVSALALLPKVKTIVLAPEDGVTALSFESLDALAAAAPEAELECRFELFGQTADWTTEKLKYCKTEIGNEGVELFREALPYLRSLTLLRFEECGITDNDMMAQLRDDFPASKVVWSIPIEGYIFMTDTTLINAGILLRDDNAHLLEYMPDVLYFDIGHYKGLSTRHHAAGGLPGSGVLRVPRHAHRRSERARGQGKAGIPQHCQSAEPEGSHAALRTQAAQDRAHLRFELHPHQPGAGGRAQRAAAGHLCQRLRRRPEQLRRLAL